MKGLVLAFVLFATVATTLAREQTITYNICDECDCPKARGPTAFNMKHVEGKNCFCSCGAEKFKECIEDADCELGLHCAAGSEKGGNGQCEDACKKPGFSCGLFDKCEINGEGEPECICDFFECKDIEVGRGVCAYDKHDMKNVIFNNDCLYENTDCERRKNNQHRLTKRSLSDCAELVEVRKRSGVDAAAFQMSGRL